MEKKWAASSWAKGIAKKTAKAEMGDFDRFTLMVARKTRVSAARLRDAADELDARIELAGDACVCMTVVETELPGMLAWSSRRGGGQGWWDREVADLGADWSGLNLPQARAVNKALKGMKKK